MKTQTLEEDCCLISECYQPIEIFVRGNDQMKYGYCMRHFMSNKKLKETKMKTNNEVKHTPTPWKATKVYPNGLCNFIESEKADTLICEVGKQDSNLVNEANAEFIVRCVNSHAALLNTLYQCQGYFESQNQDQFVTAMLKDINKAIAQAEGVGL